MAVKKGSVSKFLSSEQAQLSQEAQDTQVESCSK